MIGLWAGYQNNAKYVHRDTNGIFSDDYSSLVAKGLVEEVTYPAVDHQDEIAALKQDALELLHTGPTRGAIELLEQAESLESEERHELRGFRLTLQGIEHMEQQEDAIPACAKA